jgi:hypothetical protein
LKEGIRIDAGEVQGEKPAERRQAWFDVECKETTQKKNLVYKQMLQKRRTRALQNKYIRLRREENCIHKKKKCEQ